MQFIYFISLHIFQKDSLSNFILETEKEDGRTEMNLNTADVNEENNYSNSSIQQLEVLSFENEAPSAVNNEENESCLNIEVLHSKSKEETKKKESKFSCSLCSFKSQRETHYQKHMNLHETTSAIFHCDKCNFSTLRFTHLRHHQITHSTKPTMCPTTTCSYSTDNAKLLIKHQRLKHKVKLLFFHILCHNYCFVFCRLFPRVRIKLFEIALLAHIKPQVFIYMNDI